MPGKALSSPSPEGFNQSGVEKKLGSGGWGWELDYTDFCIPPRFTTHIPPFRSCVEAVLQCGEAQGGADSNPSSAPYWPRWVLLCLPTNHFALLN